MPEVPVDISIDADVRYCVKWCRENVQYPIEPKLIWRTPELDRSELRLRFIFRNVTDALLFKLSCV